MSTRHVAPLAPFALALLASLATAAPTATPSLPKTATEVCPTPDKTMCLSKVKSTFGGEISYLASECGQTHKDTCKPFVQDAFKNDPGRAKAPKTKVLKVGGSDIAIDPKSDKGSLRDGWSRKQYGKPAKGRALSVQGSSVLARSGLTVAPGLKAKTTNDAATPKHTKWESNGQKIESCKEYAYEKLYDAMRFSDAAANCAGDRACEYEIAFMTSTPGIASRTLVDKAGSTLKKQMPFKKKGKMAKNDMFAAASQFAYAGDWTMDELVKPEKYVLGGGGPMKHTAELDELAGSLKKGAKWYSFGCTGADCTDRKLKDEWDFHRQLHSRNATVSQAEFDEYARRKAKFRKLYDAWAASSAEGSKIWHCMMDVVDCRGNVDLVADVTPLDIVEYDPVERLDLMQSTFDKNVVEAGVAAKTKLPAGAQIPAAAGGQVMPSASWRGAGGVLAAPTRGARPPMTVKPVRCDPSHWEADYPGLPQQGGYHNGYLADFFGYGPAACKLGDFIRQEFRRKAKGMKSCLDVDDDDCDWSTDMFHDRFVATYPYGERQQALEEYCLAYTGDKIDADNIAAADKYIKDMKKLAGEALANLQGYHKSDVTIDKKKMWEVGREWIDAEAFGDKDWFAAGYDYDVSWSVKPSDLDKDSAKSICDLEGKAQAKFNIDTWLINNDMRVLEANFKAKLNDGDNGKAHAKASVEILGNDVFPEVNEYFDQTWTASGSKMIDLPSPKPSFTFMAGPIPITGSVWGSVIFGAQANGSAELKTKGKCNPDSIKFVVDTIIDPFISVAGSAQIGVGVSGFVSAGIRGSLTLVSLGLPLSTKLSTHEKPVDNTDQIFLEFTSSLDLSLSTLSGYIALYIEFLFFTDEWELFSWSGLSTEVPLMDPALEADLPMVVWPQ